MLRQRRDVSTRACEYHPRKGSLESARMSELALQVQDLVKVFDQNGVRAVDGLSFDVKAGELFALLGPNGAGKTTTIRAIVTLLRPTSGAVRVFGKDAVAEPDAVRALIGWVPQELALDRHLTGRQHLELTARLYRVPRAEAARRIDELLELVELRDRAHDLAKRYSGGMKKRLDLACGLVHRPRLLVLDEPTLGLDIQTRVRVWEFVGRLRREGTTVLLTTHYMEEADQLADRIAVVDGGRLRALGTPAELKAGFGGEVVRLDLGGRPLDEPTRAALAALPGVGEVEARGPWVLCTTASARELAPRVHEWAERSLGAAPRALSFGPASLDDVFLKLTGHGLRD